MLAGLVGIVDGCEACAVSCFDLGGGVANQGRGGCNRPALAQKERLDAGAKLPVASLSMTEVVRELWGFELEPEVRDWLGGSCC